MRTDITPTIHRRTNKKTSKCTHKIGTHNQAYSVLEWSLCHQGVSEVASSFVLFSLCSTLAGEKIRQEGR